MNYAEILADTGIIGFVLYYCSYVMMLAKLLKKVIYLRKYKTKNSVIALANVAMFLGIIYCHINLGNSNGSYSRFYDANCSRCHFYCVLF